MNNKFGCRVVWIGRAGGSGDKIGEWIRLLVRVLDGYTTMGYGPKAQGSSATSAVAIINLAKLI